MKGSILILSYLLFSITKGFCQKIKNVRIIEPEFSETPFTSTAEKESLLKVSRKENHKIIIKLYYTLHVI